MRGFMLPNGTSVSGEWADLFERMSTQAATLHLTSFEDRLANGQAWPLVRAALEGAVSARTGCKIGRDCLGRERLPLPLQRCVALADEWLRDLEPPPQVQVGPSYIDDAVRRGACDGAVRLLTNRRGCTENLTFGCGPGRRQMWTRGGCRGTFRCAGSNSDTACGYTGLSTNTHPLAIRICECA